MQGFRLETNFSREADAEHSNSAEGFLARVLRFFSRGSEWKPLPNHEEGLDVTNLPEQSGTHKYFVLQSLPSFDAREIEFVPRFWGTKAVTLLLFEFESVLNRLCVKPPKILLCIPPLLSTSHVSDRLCQI